MRWMQNMKRMKSFVEWAEMENAIKKNQNCIRRNGRLKSCEKKHFISYTKTKRTVRLMFIMIIFALILVDFDSLHLKWKLICNQRWSVRNGMKIINLTIVNWWHRDAILWLKPKRNFLFWIFKTLLVLCFSFDVSTILLLIQRTINEGKSISTFFYFAINITVNSKF